jgi:hypothetical protein
VKVIHGMSYTPTYASWDAMRDRCTNPKATGYENYGGRGIALCERWRDFRNFYADMGDRPPGTTIERIDNNGNYEPGNCRWATNTEQSRNRRSNRVVAAFGESKPVSAWIEDSRCAVSMNALIWRLEDGWETEVAITKPARPKLPNGVRAAYRLALKQGIPA